MFALERIEGMNRKTDALLSILAKNVRRCRNAKGWTQEELAHVSGFHRTYVGAVERGERNLTLSTLSALAEALDTTVIALLRESKDNEQ